MSNKSKNSLKLGGIDDDHNYVVRIPYNNELDVFQPHTFRHRLNMWNESCAYAVEKFGMPNSELYSCRMCEEWIEFWFLNESDALLFELACG